MPARSPPRAPAASAACRARPRDGRSGRASPALPPSTTCCSRPCTCVIPAGLPERSFVAKLPSVATSVGWISSIWRKRCDSQASISSGCGSRLPGGPALEDVRDVDVLARQPDPVEQLAEQLARRRRRTARPACPRGSPAPRRRTSARRVGEPEPKTTCVRVCGERAALAAGDRVAVGDQREVSRSCHTRHRNSPAAEGGLPG